MEAWAAWDNGMTTRENDDLVHMPTALLRALLDVAMDGISARIQLRTQLDDSATRLAQDEQHDAQRTDGRADDMTLAILQGMLDESEQQWRDMDDAMLTIKRANACLKREDDGAQ